MSGYADVSPVTPATDLLVDVDLVGDRCVIEVKGEVDAANVDYLIATGLLALESHYSDGIVIDLSEVTFFDSTALGGLVAMRNTARRLGRSLALRAVPPRIVTLLEITGLTGVFQVE